MSAISGIDIALVSGRREVWTGGSLIPAWPDVKADLHAFQWDLKGRRLGVPIHQLLGGKVRNKVSVYVRPPTFSFTHCSVDPETFHRSSPARVRSQTRGILT